jgi:hypothetical protein
MLDIVLFYLSTATFSCSESAVDASSATYAVKDEYGRVQLQVAITLVPGDHSLQHMAAGVTSRRDLDWRRCSVRVSAKDNAGNFQSAVNYGHDSPRPRPLILGFENVFLLRGAEPGEPGVAGRRFTGWESQTLFCRGLDRGVLGWF